MTVDSRERSRALAAIDLLLKGLLEQLKLKSQNVLSVSVIRGGPLFSSGLCAEGNQKVVTLSFCERAPGTMPVFTDLQ